MGGAAYRSDGRHEVNLTDGAARVVRDEGLLAELVLLLGRLHRAACWRRLGAGPPTTRAWGRVC